MIKGARTDWWLRIKEQGPGACSPTWCPLPFGGGFLSVPSGNGQGRGGPRLIREEKEKVLMFAGAPQVPRVAEPSSCAPAPAPALPQEGAWAAPFPELWSCRLRARSSRVTSPDPCEDPAGGCYQPPLICL